MARVYGNKSPAYLSSGSAGMGSLGIPTDLGWMCAVGDIGESVVVGMQGLKTGQLNQGIFFQSTAAATLLFTLSPYNLSASNQPEANASVIWGSQIILTPGVITPCNLIFTACQITFTAAGQVYIATS